MKLNVLDTYAFILLGLLGPGITGVVLMKFLYTESTQRDFWDQVTN